MATRQREKTARLHEEADKRPHAILRYERIAPRKVRTVIDGIRGKKVAEAEAILKFMPKSASPIVLKLLKSAVANAENNMEMTKDNLYVAEVYADQGPTLKRSQPRAHGRAFPIHKKTSHITIILDQVK